MTINSAVLSYMYICQYSKLTYFPLFHVLAELIHLYSELALLCLRWAIKQKLASAWKCSPCLLKVLSSPDSLWKGEMGTSAIGGLTPLGCMNVKWAYKQDYCHNPLKTFWSMHALIQNIWMLQKDTIACFHYLIIITVSCIVRLTFTHQFISSGYKHQGSLEYIEISIAPLCSPFTRVLNNWIWVKFLKCFQEAENLALNLHIKFFGRDYMKKFVFWKIFLFTLYAFFLPLCCVYRYRAIVKLFFRLCTSCK